MTLKQVIPLMVVFLYFYHDLACANPPSTQSLDIGSPLQGGLVGCLNGGLNNFIVIKYDINQAWPWGNYNSVTQANSTTDGAKNTKKIINKQSSISNAAFICAALNLDDSGRDCIAPKTCYNDWFLPSQEQLNCLFHNRKKIGYFYQSYYWSSTESRKSAKYTALDQSFVSERVEQFDTIKNTRLAVRCIRHLSL